MDRWRSADLVEFAAKWLKIITVAELIQYPAAHKRFINKLGNDAAHATRRLHYVYF
jgi:hypothetical protein